LPELPKLLDGWRWKQDGPGEWIATNGTCSAWVDGGNLVVEEDDYTRYGTVPIQIAQALLRLAKVEPAPTLNEALGTLEERILQLEEAVAYNAVGVASLAAQTTVTPTCASAVGGAMLRLGERGLAVFAKFGIDDAITRVRDEGQVS
jgi:hypothetical protein